MIEFEPTSAKVLWAFGDAAKDDLFSKTLGSCQRLANGNTLITESENGRALEVDSQGRLVWEFNSPERAGDGNRLVAVLFEMVRYPVNFMRPNSADRSPRKEESRP